MKGSIYISKLVKNLVAIWKTLKSTKHKVWIPVWSGSLGLHYNNAVLFKNV